MAGATPETIHVLYVGEAGLADAAGRHLDAEDERFAVEAAATDEALDRLDAGGFDCVVAAVDDAAFLSAVREAHPDLPLVVVAEGAEDAVTSGSLPAGPTDFFLGGASPLLADRVEHTLRRHRDLQQSRERFEKVFEHSNDAIMVVDMADEEFLAVNPAACEMLGYDREELLDLHPEDIHPSDIDRVREEFISQVLSEGSGWTDDLLCLTKDGERIPTEISGAVLDPVGEAEPTRMVAILRDISEREAYRGELEQQIERLDEFASVVSHDLRNPLNVAQGRLELARAECDSEHLEDIAGALDRMDDIIEATLTLARGGDTVGETEPVDVGDLVEGCWENVAMGEATLRVEDPPTVDADPDRLRHVVENLFRNAVEHGSTSSRPEADDAVEHGGEDVTVEVGSLDGDDGFYVADDGPGIPESEREDVFDAGYSAGEGTGLGLAIVRQIVEAHDGEVAVAESEAGGARFELRMASRR